MPDNPYKINSEIPEILRRWRVARDQINKMGDEKRSKIMNAIENLIRRVK
jgi:hypothetical protein